MSLAFAAKEMMSTSNQKFELPLPPGPNLVTARGLALIEARVAELEAALPSITAALTADREWKKVNVKNLRIEQIR